MPIVLPFFFKVKMEPEQIKDFVPAKMLNKHYGSTFAHPYELHQTKNDDRIADNMSVPNYQWTTQLSYNHWSTLFSFYNISYDNRYLTIMPSIYLPIFSSEDQQIDVSTKASYYDRVRTLMFTLNRLSSNKEISRETYFIVTRFVLLIL